MGMHHIVLPRVKLGLFRDRFLLLCSQVHLDPALTTARMLGGCAVRQ
jgi:hypothetical protein